MATPKQPGKPKKLTISPKMSKVDRQRLRLFLDLWKDSNVPTIESNVAYKIERDGKKEFVYIDHEVAIRPSRHEGEVRYESLGEFLGEGGFGSTHKAQYYIKPVGDDDVAIRASKKAVKFQMNPFGDEKWEEHQKKESKISKVAYDGKAHLRVGVGEYLNEVGQSFQTSTSTLTVPYFAAGKLQGLTPAESIHLMVAAAEALVNLHEKGIVHRDVKKDNYIFNREKLTAQPIDFGLSHPEDKPEGAAGTALFLAPEIASEVQIASNQRRDPDPKHFTKKVDSFAFAGMMLMLAGFPETEEIRFPKNARGIDYRYLARTGYRGVDEFFENYDAPDQDKKELLEIIKGASAVSATKRFDMKEDVLPKLRKIQARLLKKDYQALQYAIGEAIKPLDQYFVDNNAAAASDHKLHNKLAVIQSTIFALNLQRNYLDKGLKENKFSKQEYDRVYEHVINLLKDNAPKQIFKHRAGLSKLFSKLTRTMQYLIKLMKGSDILQNNDFTLTASGKAFKVAHKQIEAAHSQRFESAKRDEPGQQHDEDGEGEGKGPKVPR